MTNKLTTGTRVQRIASDYTNGRQGNVVEMGEGGNRARVMWTVESNGTPSVVVVMGSGSDWFAPQVRVSDLLIVNDPTLKPCECGSKRAIGIGTGNTSQLGPNRSQPRTKHPGFLFSHEESFLYPPQRIPIAPIEHTNSPNRRYRRKRKKLGRSCKLQGPGNTPLS